MLICGRGVGTINCEVSPTDERLGLQQVRCTSIDGRITRLIVPICLPPIRPLKYLLYFSQADCSLQSLILRRQALQSVYTVFVIPVYLVLLIYHYFSAKVEQIIIKNTFFCSLLCLKPNNKHIIVVKQ